jgi:mannose-6-phosphate isomerase-like protein (cupin superfamily)
MVGNSRPALIPAGGGAIFTFPMGNRAEVKADSANGLGFGFFRSELPPGAGMPFLHLHRTMDEAFYVAEGTVEYRLGDAYETAAAGAAVLIPAGVPHCFRSVGPSRALVVVISSPASAVDMVEELARGEFVPDRIAAVLEACDSELLERRPHWAPSNG